MMCRGRSLLPSSPLRASSQSSVLSRSQSMSRSRCRLVSPPKAWIELELKMCIRPTLTTGMHPDLELENQTKSTNLQMNSHKMILAPQRVLTVLTLTLLPKHC